MRRRGGSGGGASSGCKSAQMTLSAWSCSSSVLSTSASRRRMPALAASCSRMPTKARTTNTLIRTARSLRNKFAAITAPCSVNAQGRYALPRCFAEFIAIRDEFTSISLFPTYSNLDIATCEVKFSSVSLPVAAELVTNCDLFTSLIL